jgi:cytochrome c oxidase subunit II
MILQAVSAGAILLASSSEWWMPPNGARHGIAVDRLMKANLLALGICFVIAHLWMVAALLRRRRHDPSVWKTEILPLTLLCFLYVAMAVAAQRLWATDRFEGPSLEALQVEAVGVQFQWYFRYPGYDETFGATRLQLVRPAAGNPLGLDPKDSHASDDVVSSELVLPAGREVDLRLRSHDVIHGLFIPGMRLKQNAVPGMVLHVHFTPITAGEYDIVCSQICGLGHSRMQAKLRVVSPGAYRDWMAGREAARASEAQ